MRWLGSVKAVLACVARRRIAAGAAGAACAVGAPLRSASKKAADRLAAAFPNAVLVHTPVHASWLNQVEIYFSVAQRKVVTPNDFTDLGEVRDRLRAFEDHYNATTQPFQWKFTTSDLDDLLARLDRYTTDHPPESSVGLAA
ncbi:hypothetical protein ABZS88_25665 [Streptomyces sp. NPDC005480]|uniref:hypothetical protein n=1 Tax=Streptomyces sp. NPDC005480 TaxID=3154880 RepID=UPI0033AC8273